MTESCEGRFRLSRFAQLGMADGETNKRPRWYSCHLGVAGERFAIASSTCQDDTKEILKPGATFEAWVTAENVPYKDVSYREHLREGLLKAGLPE